MLPTSMSQQPQPSLIISKLTNIQNLKIRMSAIINDSSATLLSRAYINTSTRFALILGTGTNAAVHLPIPALGASKFGKRPQSWHDQARHVLVNTEMSMFGRGVLPMTRWDEALNENHTYPDYQPLEYMITGRYLGEILRLVMAEGVETAGLFDGEMPPSLHEPYSLDTALMAVLEADDSHSLSTSSAYFQKHHPSSLSPPSKSDIVFLRTVSSFISRRAGAYLATTVHALWLLRNEAEAAEGEDDRDISIACDGSVINKYPGFKRTCQQFLDDMIEVDGKGGSILLEPAVESAILGAAVAVACGDDC